MNVFNVVKKEQLMFLPVAAAMYTCVYYFTLVKLKNERAYPCCEHVALSYVEKFLHTKQ
jgi:hypothetical protein